MITRIIPKAGPCVAALAAVLVLSACQPGTNGAAPTADQVAAVQTKLASESFETYRELTDSFKTAADRLVCLNLCNALLANGSLDGQHIATWPHPPSLWGAATLRRTTRQTD